VYRIPRYSIAIEFRAELNPAQGPGFGPGPFSFLHFSFLRQLAQQPRRQPNWVGDDALNLRCSFAARSFDLYQPVSNRIRSVDRAAVKSGRNLCPVSQVRHSARPSAHSEFDHSPSTKACACSSTLSFAASNEFLQNAFICGREWFKEYDVAPNCADNDTLVISIDTAMKGDELADFSVATVWLARGEHSYLIDLWRERVDYPNLKHAIWRLREKHPKATLLIEDKGSGTSLIQGAARKQYWRYSGKSGG
jgi:hypothetical protein